MNLGKCRKQIFKNAEDALNLEKFLAFEDNLSLNYNSNVI